MKYVSKARARSSYPSNVAYPVQVDIIQQVSVTNCMQDLMRLYGCTPPVCTQRRRLSACQAPLYRLHICNQAGAGGYQRCTAVSQGAWESLNCTPLRCLLAAQEKLLDGCHRAGTGRVAHFDSGRGTHAGPGSGLVSRAAGWQGLREVAGEGALLIRDGAGGHVRGTATEGRHIHGGCKGADRERERCLILGMCSHNGYGIQKVPHAHSDGVMAAQAIHAREA